MVLSKLIMVLKNEGNIMNLFNPPKFVKGSLVGLNGNAFALMGHFKDSQYVKVGQRKNGKRLPTNVWKAIMTR